MFFEDLDSLFRCVLEKNRVLVFGDLGRLPHVVVEHLSTHHSMLKIYFVSIQYPLSIPNNVQQFRQITERDATKAKCDLLVLLEPRDHAIVPANYPNAGSIVVFTSHAILDIKNSETVFLGIYFRSTRDRIDRMSRIQEKMEGVEESDDVEIVKRHVAHESVITIGPESHCDVVLSSGKRVSPPPTATQNFVIVDLSKVTRPLSIFLFYLDAIDYMMENIDQIESWCVCFATEGTRKYENFVQESIDRLHCATYFRPHLKRLLPLLPFYKSGTIDATYDLPVSRIVRHEYVSPNSLDEAFKTAIVHDSAELVGGVFSILH